MALLTLENLTARQRDVLTLAANGLTRAQTGKLLGISPRTVDFHWREINDWLYMAGYEQPNAPLAVAHFFAGGCPVWDGPLRPWSINDRSRRAKRSDAARAEAVRACIAREPCREPGRTEAAPLVTPCGGEAGE